MLRAAADVLTSAGFDALDLADLARRSAVGKTTVYRRWGTPAGVVADLLASLAEESVPRTETGTLLGDLRANARLVRETLADPRQGQLFKAVIAAACDARTAEALHRFYEIRVAEWSPCVMQAADRGDAGRSRGRPGRPSRRDRGRGRRVPPPTPRAPHRSPVSR